MHLGLSWFLLLHLLLSTEKGGQEGHGDPTRDSPIGLHVQQVLGTWQISTRAHATALSTISIASASSSRTIGSNAPWISCLDSEPHRISVEKAGRPPKHRLTQSIIASPLRELYLTNHDRFNPNAMLHFGGG
jgi:hypothetical protein